MPNTGSLRKRRGTNFPRTHVTATHTCRLPLSTHQVQGESSGACGRWCARAGGSRVGRRGHAAPHTSRASPSAASLSSQRQEARATQSMRGSLSRRFGGRTRYRRRATATTVTVRPVAFTVVAMPPATPAANVLRNLHSAACMLAPVLGRRQQQQQQQQQRRARTSSRLPSGMRTSAPATTPRPRGGDL